MNKNGVSLIESLAVIVIISTLVSVGYFLTTRVTNTSNENAMLVMANDIKGGIIDYMIIHKPANNIFQVNLIPLDNEYESINFKANDPWGKPYSKLYADIEKNSGSLAIDVYLEVNNKGCYVLFENNNVLYRSGDTCN